jgi:hypothetical protein
MTDDTRGELIDAWVDRLQTRMTAPNLPVFAFDEYQARVMAEVLADVALSPRVGPCPECGGRATTFEHDPHSQSVQALRKVKCPAPGCNGSGQVTVEPLAYLRAELEQVGWAWRRPGWSWFLTLRRAPTQRPDTENVPLFRLRSAAPEEG